MKLTWKNLRENIYMKTIGLLGGTGWSSTIRYYTILNQLIHKKLGGYHSAKILLKSIDYHEIMSNYGKDDNKIADILHEELIDLMSLDLDCIIICCNSLHKYYDQIKHHLYPDKDIPVFHAVELVAQHAQKNHYKKVLLLATKPTMEDGFFTRTLKDHDIQTTIPNESERDIMQKIVSEELIHNTITQDSKNYFVNLIATYSDCQALVLGCTEFSLLIDGSNSALPIIDPVQLQCTTAIEYALQEIKPIDSKFLLQN